MGHLKVARVPAKKKSAARKTIDRTDQSIFSPHDNITGRQKKIVDYVKKTSQAKVSEVSTFFKGLSTKTIQRDLHMLVQKNVLKREGERRWTSYSPIDDSHYSVS